MISEILPVEVASAEASEDPRCAVLFAEEEAVVARAVDKRRREFTTVRHCARRALAELGFQPAPLLPGPRGAPRWPEGAVGSMTHCKGYRAAAVARASQVRTIGIDAEPHDALPSGVLDAIGLTEEKRALEQLAAAGGTVCWDRLLFCAKEAVYKAWFPLTGRWLGFSDASVAIDPVARTFHARLQVVGPEVGGTVLSGFSGRWLIGNGLVLAAVTVLDSGDR
ncbi:MAG: 4'-phosphopantetheinyl transferase family protein [Sciscionella sp.]